MRRAGIAVVAAALVLAAWWLSGGEGPPAPPPTERAAAQPPAAGATAAPARADGQEQAVDRGEHVAAAAPSERSPQVTWRGQVVDARGQPMIGALVRSASGSVARALDEGWFALEAPLARGDALLITAPGHAPRAISCADFVGGAQVVLQPAGLVSVEVVDAETGLRVDGYAVQLVGATDAGLRADPVELRSRPGGDLLEARVSVESPALLRVLGDEERFAPSAPRSVELDATKPRAARFELCAWTEVTVVVRDVAGAPVAGALVEVLAMPDGRRCEVDTLAVTDWRELTPSRAALWFRARADARGRLVARVPSRGTFTLRASDAVGGCTIARDMTRAAVVDAELPLTLSR